MPQYYQVLLNGHPIKRWTTKADAEAMAERWQGSHGGYRGGSGITKLKDRGDWLEVKLDTEANKEFDARYKVFKAGERQVIQYEQRVDTMDDADPEMLRR